MTFDKLDVKRACALLEASFGQHDQVPIMLAVAAGMAEKLAESSSDDVAAIRRTHEHLVARFKGMPSLLAPDDALVAISVVFSALAFPDPPETKEWAAVRAADAARRDRLDRQRAIPAGFPKLHFHKPAVRVNHTFPGVLLCKSAE